MLSRFSRLGSSGSKIRPGQTLQCLKFARPLSDNAAIEPHDAIKKFVSSLPSEHRADGKGQFEIKECRLCSKEGYEKADNCWKLTVRTDGSYYCYRCADTGSFELLQHKLSVPVSSRKRIRKVPPEAMANLIRVPSNSSSNGKVITGKGISPALSHNTNAKVEEAIEAAKKIDYVMPDQVETQKFHTDLFSHAQSSNASTPSTALTIVSPTNSPSQNDAASVFNYLCNVRCLSPEILERYRVGMSKQSFVDGTGSCVPSVLLMSCYRLLFVV
jgi:hypothetical protein